MAYASSRRRGRYFGLMAGAALGSLLIAQSASAQDAPPEPANAVEQAPSNEEIIVSGIRASLEASASIKRESATIVDAVSAEDVGKFPDANIAESLQRITGVSIERNGGEGQYISVRGLGPQFSTVLLNGRTIATDNDGREFSFDVLSSDIIARAEVFKAPLPYLQSGGIGGTVNISTARPLDRNAPGFKGSASVSGQYDTLRQKLSPEVSGVVSWVNPDETFGVLLGASYSQRKSQVDSSNASNFSFRQGTSQRYPAGDPRAGKLVDGNVMVDAPESSSGLTIADIKPLTGGWVQQQLVFKREIQSRERLSFNGAVQFIPSDSLKISLDGLYSKFDVKSSGTEFSGFFNPPFINPVLDENRTVISFSRPSRDFAARNPLIAGDIGLSQNDAPLTSSHRDATTYALGGNIEYQAADNLKFVLDVSHSKATKDTEDAFVVLGAYAETSPFMDLTDNDSGIPTISNLTRLTDKSLQRLHYTNVSRGEVEDEILEYRLSGQWDIDKGPLKNISFGGAMTDRTKGRNSFNAGGSGLLQGIVQCAYCGYNVPFDTSILSEFSLKGFLKGVPGSESVPAAILTASMADVFAALNNPANLNNPAQGRSAADTAKFMTFLASGEADPLYGIYTPTFDPGGSFRVDEKIYSAYFNTDWGGDLGDLPWSANLGVRVDFTDVASSGIDRPVLQFRETPGDTNLLISFGPTSNVTVKNDYVNFLPSFNLKVEPTDNTVLRFGFARTVTRPTLTALGVSNGYGGRSNSPTSGGGNPYLEAFEASNFDLSFEYYFDRLSYFSVAGFHKELGNFIETTTVPIVRPIVFPAGNGGRTQDETVNITFLDTRQRNGENGSITGLELAVQKSLFAGFGASANYTFVSSNIDREASSPIAGCNYEGLSKHGFNASVFYDNGPLQGRIAYNYRSGFPTSCTGGGGGNSPAEREAYSQVDFSLGYDITDTFQVFAEGINITGSDTRNYTRFKNRFLSYADTGARYSLGVRAKF